MASSSSAEAAASAEVPNLPRPGSRPSSRSLSLAVSDSESEVDCSLSVGDDFTDTSTRPTSRTVVAKIEISDLLAPLEVKLHSRLDALEALLEQRCSELRQRARHCDVRLEFDTRRLDLWDTRTTEIERRLDEVEKAISLGNQCGSCGDSGLRLHVKVLQEQMQETTASLQSYLREEATKIQDLSEGLRTCNDGHTTLQSNIDEVWRNLKAGRHESHDKYQALSDTVEICLQSLMSKFSRDCTPNLNDTLAESVRSLEVTDILKAPQLPLPPAPPAGEGSVNMAPAVEKVEKTETPEMADEPEKDTAGDCAAPLSPSCFYRNVEMSRSRAKISVPAIGTLPVPKPSSPGWRSPSSGDLSLQPQPQQQQQQQHSHQQQALRPRSPGKAETNLVRLRRTTGASGSGGSVATTARGAPISLSAIVRSRRKASEAKT